MMTKIRRIDLPRAPQRPPVAPVRLRNVALELGERRVDLDTRALVMAVLNRTPDSFFDRGAHFELDTALRRAEELVGAGADIIDIGGLKAGPGDWVSPAEEIDRVLPVITAVAERFDIPISIDSFRSEVTREALGAGACVVNDISGLSDPAMIDYASRSNAALVICHIQGRPRVPNPEPHYGDLRRDVIEYLSERIGRCRRAGLSDSHIVVDAAFDFGKTERQSLELFAHTAELTALGPPVLISASNKRYLGELLGTDVEDRNEASLASVAFGMHQGARIFRVHDALGTRRVVDTIAALLEAAFEAESA